MPACARHPTPTEASETCSLQACSKQVHAMQPPLTPTTNKATLGSPACARIKTRRWHLTLAVCRLPSCARHQTRRRPLAACSLQACSERVHAMQPHNEIDCNSFLCTFTALYYFPFSANGLACFLNKCDVANVRKYTQDIQTSDFLYVGAAPRRRRRLRQRGGGGIY